MKYRIDPLVLGLLIAVLLSYFFPQPATFHDGKPLKIVITIGIGLIFFFYGLKLSVEEMKSGLKNWKLHLIVQSFTFLLFPLLLLPFYPFVKDPESYNFWLSFFFLASLPSTVSSSVVLTSLAKGNVPAAIFNASISGLIGVLLTPLWMSLFLSFEGGLSFGSLYFQLVVQILVPVALGLLLRKKWGTWAKKRSKMLSNFDKSIILLIVYSTFAKSFIDKIFETTGKFYLLFVFGACLVLFFSVYFLLKFLCKKVFHFETEDVITGTFCGSKKSMTHGTVFGNILFVANPNIGLYFLPLMIYHASQILILSVFAQRYGKRLSKKKGK